MFVRIEKKGCKIHFKTIFTQKIASKFPNNYKQTKVFSGESYANNLLFTTSQIIQ